MSAININDSEFDSAVIKQKQTAIVFFCATWNGGCKTSMPTFEQRAGANSGILSFYKLDVDGNQTTPQSYGIRAIPTLMVFKNGQVIAQLVGAFTGAKLDALINKV